MDLLRYDVVDVFTTDGACAGAGGAVARTSVFGTVNRGTGGELLALP